MGYDLVTYDVKDAVATITLNRPDAYNALTVPLCRELFEAAVEADEDPSVRCVVLTGAGKAFCGGGDVKDFVANADRIGILLKHVTTYFHAAISHLVRAGKPYITGVNGVAAGGGMSLALSGDLVIAAESARFTMAYKNIGATPDGSSSYFLPRIIGVRRAMELYLTDRVLSAREAQEWGLVNRVHADADFPGALRALAEELARGPTLAFGRGKRLLYGSSEEGLESQMALESRGIAESGHTGDFAGATVAFTRKERPTFRGR